MESDRRQNPDSLGSHPERSAELLAWLQLRAALRTMIDSWDTSEAEKTMERVFDLTHRRAYNFALAIFPSRATADRAVEKAYDFTLHYPRENPDDLAQFWPCMERVMRMVADEARRAAFRRRRVHVLMLIPFAPLFDAVQDARAGNVVELSATLHYLARTSDEAMRRLADELEHLLRRNVDALVEVVGSGDGWLDRKPCELTAWFRAGDASSSASAPQEDDNPWVLGAPESWCVPLAPSTGTELVDEHAAVPANRGCAPSVDTPPTAHAIAMKQRLIRALLHGDTDQPDLHSAALAARSVLGATTGHTVHLAYAA